MKAESVRFAGGRARVGPLTLGQANMRRCVLRDDPSHLNACMIWPLPTGISFERITYALRTLLLRHESLRTTFPSDPEPTQRVAGAGELRVAVHEVGEAPLKFAEETGRRMRAVRFDPSDELPLRAAVVTSDAVPTHVVLVLCHMAVDAVALDLLAREWKELMNGRPLAPSVAMQPLDLAEIEQSAVGLRRAASSLRYWAGLLEHQPQATFAVSEAAETDWMIQPLRIRSRRAAHALDRIEARTGGGRSTIVLAAMCALVGHRTAQRNCMVALLSANRYLPELADYFGTVAQDALMAVDLGASTFDEVIRRVRARSLAAYRHSWFDSNDLWEVIDGTGRSRGTNFARDCVFNDLTSLTLEGLQFGPPRRDDPYDRAQEVQLTWLPPESMLTRLMLWAVNLDDEVELSVWADPQCLSKVEAEGFGRGIIRLLITAAERDVDLGELAELSGIQPVFRGPGWCSIDSCWIEVAAVQRLLADVLGDLPFFVDLVPDRHLGHRLVCYVALDDQREDTDSRTPERIHADCMEALTAFRPTAMAPHHYVICAGAPDERDDLKSWQSRPVISEGAGRDVARP